MCVSFAVASCHGKQRYGNNIFRHKENAQKTSTNKGSRAHPGKVLGVSQKDGPLLSDAVVMVELHQLVEGGEELIPHVVLTAAILQHLEMLDVVPVAAKQTQRENLIRT